MSRKNTLLFLLLLSTLLINLACGFSASTANIKAAKLSKDNEGTQPVSTFTAKDTFYCNVDLANAPADTTVKAVWTAVKAEGADANTKIGETELKSADGTLHFKLSNDNPWPAGQYKVDLYLNGKLDRSLEFQVQ